MAKFTQGDIVVITDSRAEGAIARIENWRGGRVAPYVVRILETKGCHYKAGEISYFSGRDMELKEMQGKKKVYCAYQGCSIYSFESKGTLLWQCHNHLDCTEKPQQPQCISLEEKVDLILDHLKLDVTIEPRKAVLVERKEETTE
jgi:hypothetical protein